MSDEGFFRRHDTLSHPDRANANLGGVKTPLIQRLYSIAIFDAISGNVIEAEDLDPKKRSNLAEYFFTLPPKTYEISEPATTQIVYTQNGGKFVESHGSLTKEIRLSGTTGLRPNKSSPSHVNLLSSVENFLDQVNPASIFASNSIPLDKEATGFDDIVFLRNIFRKYFDIKHGSTAASHTLFLFRNAKDDDYWVVEPTEFRLSQSASSPLTYEYNISLKTLSKFDYQLNVPDDPLAKMRAQTTTLTRFRNYVRHLSNAFHIINFEFQKLQGRISFSIDTVKNPLLGVISGLSAMKSTYDSLPMFIRHDVDQLSAALRQLQDELADWTLTLERRSQPTVDANNVDFKRLVDVTLLRRTVNRLRVTCAKLQTEQSLRINAGPQYDYRRARYESRYDRTEDPAGPRAEPATGGSSTFLGHQRGAGVVAVGRVGADENIRDVSARLLGDRGSWHTLVVLNDLKPPYISPFGGQNLLKPGDSILYPAAEGASTSQTTGKASTEEGENPLYAVFGVDVRLVPAPGSESGIYTFALSPSGDLDLVSGLDNLKQGVILKFITEKGNLTVHPRYGAQFAIGTKSTPDSFNTFRIDTQSTILSDTRIRAVHNLNFLVKEDKLYARADLIPVGTADVVNTEFIVRG